MHRHHRATPVAGQRRPLLHLQPTPCAHWLSEYARWHAAHRHAPGAEYLVYTCRPFMPGTNPRCLGFGDRFRIIAYLLRLAAYRRQVLLVDWLSPVPLSDFFEPTDLGSTRIEWRVTAEEAAALRDVPVNRWNGPAPGGDEFWSSGRQYTRVTGNTHWSSDLGSRNASRGERGGGEFRADSLGCLIRALFTATPYLRGTVEARRRALFADQPFDGVHLRLGDGAPGNPYKFAKAPVLLKKDVRMTVGDATRILDCLVREGKVPLFLATDNTPLKAVVLGGAGAGINASVLLPRSVTARVRAQGCAECMVNPVFKHDFNRSDVAEIFLDLMMLTLSRCFYHGGSNFANTVLALAPPGLCDKHLPRREHACAAPAG